MKAVLAEGQCSRWLWDKMRLCSNQGLAVNEFPDIVETELLCHRHRTDQRRTIQYEVNQVVDRAARWVGEYERENEAMKRRLEVEKDARERRDTRSTDQRLVELAEENLRLREALARNGEHEVVYFLQRTDGAVKIGTSKRFDQRMKSLEKEHGPLVLLGTVDGYYEREKEEHQRFADYRLEPKAEWFDPHPSLLSYIEEVAA